MYAREFGRRVQVVFRVFDKLLRLALVALCLQERDRRKVFIGRANNSPILARVGEPGVELPRKPRADRHVEFRYGRSVYNAACKRQKTRFNETDVAFQHGIDLERKSRELYDVVLEKQLNVAVRANAIGESVIERLTPRCRILQKRCRKARRVQRDVFLQNLAVRAQCPHDFALLFWVTLRAIAADAKIQPQTRIGEVDHGIEQLEKTNALSRIQHHGSP